ncbi:MAG: OFA family MFS transporter [Desulfobacterales bacterium]|jgi:OFA family oxalate/formate antiporter-like MFS transporter|nr:OFA family MFS transporter [Desulfobacterales bacterium]
MMLTSIYQYSWFLFAFEIQKNWGWSLASLGLIYTIFHYTSTLVMPFSGMIADSCGPRRVALGASFLVAAGFILCAFFPHPWAFPLFYGLGGIGCGVLYGVSIATAIKWFEDRRGLASGLVALGFGGGTALFNLIIVRMLEILGLTTTLFYLGILMLAFLVPLSFVYAYPPASRAGTGVRAANAGSFAGPRDFRPLQMLSTRQWYLIYFSFSVTVSLVLLFGAQMKHLAREYDLPDPHFSLLLVLFPLANGASRVLAGVISDRFGRSITMVAFYTLLGLSILLLLLFGRSPLIFVSLVILASLLGGAPFALYPAVIGDFYGSRYATTNYGITYTAKAWAGLISGWFCGALAAYFGSFTVPLALVASASLLAAGLSLPRFLKAPPCLTRQPDGGS